MATQTPTCLRTPKAATPEGIAPSERPSCGASLVLAMLLNAWSPPSLRLSRSQELTRTGRLMYLSSRDLLMRCRAAWKATGTHAARGKLFGTLDALKPLIEAIFELQAAFLAKADDPLGYEDALHAAAQAAFRFRASAPRSAGAPAVPVAQKEEVA